MIDLTSIVIAVGSGTTSAIVTVATLRRDIHWIKETQDSNKLETNRRLTNIEQRVLELERENR